ncbi:MAG: GAF domain-containing protein, partial [Candidatus Eremiobacteraeota bacterium]|nr:GAF domain-containing protein [Candidatus Eremiobacteraeota bacterium]
NELEVGGRSGEESRIARLLASEIEPVFDSLESFSTNVHDSVEGYRVAVCSESGDLYTERRAYDESVDYLTCRLIDVLTSQQKLAQKTFPHLFEMYRTDGVEHTIYVGNSLAERDDFSKLHLKELRLWQLKTVCMMAQVCFEMESEMARPLQVAHLILAQSDPVGLRFSQEEKTFNVDGAYNTSYEIIKKRIDKAHIKGTDERLTQPGKIALVYSQTSEAEEYRLYIDYLQQQGYLQAGIETLDLEDLQGVYGLKALRVAVESSQDSKIFRPSDEGADKHL